LKLKTKELRIQKKWSVVQLSKKSGVARGYLCELESGKYKNPGGEIICKLCKALGTTPNDLIEEKYWR
jgi:putative transcriptional regulator